MERICFRGVVGARWPTLILLCVAFLACTSGDSSSNIARFSGDDPEMNAAIDSARATVGFFLERIADPPPSQTYASVKVRFGDSTLGEHIWLDSVSFDGVRLHGLLNEDAVDFPDLKRGDSVSRAPDQISDWMIVDGGVVCGGFTTRVVREHMSVAERASADSSLAWTGLVSWAPADSCR